MNFLIRKSTLLAGCGLAAMAAPAVAQDAAIDDDNIIVVTAQNRAEDVQDVPIAMDVIGADELANAGFSNANDISKIAPAVQLTQDQGTVKITVRGVGTTSNDEAQDTSVVANIDGEYINRPNVLSVALFDLERVEVLRGPQGTLYGRNSTGGAINFITRKPGNEFAANGAVTYGNYDTIRVEGGVDVPVGEIGGFRVSGFYEDRDGYVKHPAGYGFGPFPAFAGGRSDDNKAFGGRGVFAFESGGLSGNIQAEYAEREFTPQAFAFADLNQPGNAPTGPGCNRSGFEQVAPAYAETLCIPSSTNYLSSLDRSEYPSPGFGLGIVKQDTWAVRGRLAYEFSDAATLTYIGGYRDFSGGASDSSQFVTLPVAYRSFNFMDEARTQSHELRLNGEVGNGIIYQLGGFYFKEKLRRESGFFLPIGGANGTFLSYFGRGIDSESKSVFGQVEVPLGETLTAIGGLRYTDNKRDALYLNASPFGAGPPDAFIAPDPTDLSSYLFNSGPSRKDFTLLPYVSPVVLATDEDKVTWLLGLNYQPNPDTLIYGKVSTGFKGGGFDSVGNYDPETNTAYEIGLKKNFGDAGQHIFNLSSFYYDYKNLQVTVLLDTLVGAQVFNAGKAKIWGIEAEAAIELDENDHFNASFNYLNAEYKQLLGQYAVFCVGGCGITGIGDLDPTTPGIQQPDFAGNTPPFSPEFVITMGYEHVFDLNGAGTITGRADTVFKSSYFTDFFNYRDGMQKAFTQTDLTLEYKPESENFSVLLFVRNLENTRPLTYGGLTAAGPDDIFNWQFGTPRTYGVKVGFDF